MPRSMFISPVFAIALAVAVSLGGCGSTSTTNVASDISAIGKLTGQTLVTIGGIAVAVECSAVPATAFTAAGGVIKIVAPNSTDAQTAANVLQANAAIAAQLCPLYTTIAASVGNVSGKPSSLSVRAPKSIAAKTVRCSVETRSPFLYVCER